jgi:hypothetical protein
MHTAAAATTATTAAAAAAAIPPRAGPRHGYGASLFLAVRITHTPPPSHPRTFQLAFGRELVVFWREFVVDGREFVANWRTRHFKWRECAAQDWP